MQLRPARHVIGTLATAFMLTASLGACCRQKATVEDAGPSQRGSLEAGKKGRGFGVLVEGARPDVRDNSAARTAGEVTTSARLLLSSFSPSDGLRIAVRFGPAVATDGRSPVYDWSPSLASTRFTIVGPKGRRVLRVASPPKLEPLGMGRAMVLKLTGAGLDYWSETAAWESPDSDLFVTPGSYTIEIAGDIDTKAGDKRPYSVGPLTFDVRAEGADFLPIANLAKGALTAIAPHAARVNVGSAEKTAVDDVAGNRWLRFAGASDEGRYEAHVIDALVSPGGALIALQELRYFTCVAEGTMIATTEGPRPVESLSLGNTLWGFDTDGARTRPVQLVSISRAHRRDLVRIGDLRLTPEHPVWADGRWVPAGEVTRGMSLLDLERKPLTIGRVARVEADVPVYDLSVTWPHTFFAGGILVHNKAVPVSIAPGDPWDGTFRRTTDNTGN